MVVRLWGTSHNLYLRGSPRRIILISLCPCAQQLVAVVIRVVLRRAIDSLSQAVPVAIKGVACAVSRASLAGELRAIRA